jgi:hypothetical protein
MKMNGAEAMKNRLWLHDEQFEQYDFWDKIDGSWVEVYRFLAKENRIMHLAWPVSHETLTTEQEAVTPNFRHVIEAVFTKYSNRDFKRVD